MSSLSSYFVWFVSTKFVLFGHSLSWGKSWSEKRERCSSGGAQRSISTFMRCLVSFFFGRTKKNILLLEVNNFKRDRRLDCVIIFEVTENKSGIYTPPETNTMILTRKRKETQIFLLLLDSLRICSSFAGFLRSLLALELY
jgi:hypothetical protein